MLKTVPGSGWSADRWLPGNAFLLRLTTVRGVNLKGPCFTKLKEGPCSRSEVNLELFEGLASRLDGLVEVLPGMGDTHEAGFVL